MSLTYKSVALVDIFSYIVNSIKSTGTVDNVTIVDGIATIESANSFKVDDIVQINSTQYLIVSANEIAFSVTDDGLILVGNPWSSLAPYFMYGHPVEIANRLNALDASSELLKYQKYPLIILLQDFDEDFSEVKYYCKSTVTLIVVNISELNYYSEDRYEFNFKPIIYPLYNELVKAIDTSGFFADYNIVATDMPMLGSYRDGKNMLNDWLDGRQLVLDFSLYNGILSECKNNNITIIN